LPFNTIGVCFLYPEAPSPPPPGPVIYHQAVLLTENGIFRLRVSPATKASAPPVANSTAAASAPSGVSVTLLGAHLWPQDWTVASTRSIQVGRRNRLRARAPLGRCSSSGRGSDHTGSSRRLTRGVERGSVLPASLGLHVGHRSSAPIQAVSHNRHALACRVLIIHL
jgi:hypothetical protein